jgi:hypothetical protein
MTTEEAVVARCPAGHEEVTLADSFIEPSNRDCNRCGAPLEEVRRGFVRTYPITVSGRYR